LPIIIIFPYRTPSLRLAGPVLTLPGGEVRRRARIDNLVAGTDLPPAAHRKRARCFYSRRRCVKLRRSFSISGFAKREKVGRMAEIGSTSIV